MDGVKVISRASLQSSKPDMMALAETNGEYSFQNLWLGFSL